MKPLNADFVAEVAEGLEPIYQYNNHHWGNEEETPRTPEIERAIYKLYASGSKLGFPIGSGGIWLDEDGDGLVIEYRRSIEFRWDGGSLYMA